jgi:polysaccharide chain length determinant protein (PEP-CTERM system associated)
MLPGRKYTPEEIIRILLKHKWLVVIPFVVGLAGAIGVAMQIKERYRSETLIMVMPQRISSEILPQMVNDQIEDRLPSISDQILSRSRLELVINELDLYADERRKGAIMEDVVQRMRDKDIKIGIEGRGKQTFRVSFESADPVTAYKTASKLASLYIDESQKDKDALAQSTSAFLESELETTKAKLIEAESRLAAYKKQHAGQLPSEAESNQQAIQSAQLQLQAVGQTVNRARERRFLTQQQLVDLQNTQVPAADPTPGAAATQLTAAQQLEAAEAALALAKRRYTPDHPDIRAMERSVKELRAKADVEASAAPQSRPSRLVTATEAARQKRIRDLEAEMTIIDQQIASAEREERSLKDSIAGYQGRLSAVPTREAELVELNRDYTTLDASYKELLKKKEASDLAANVERRQIGETFRVIDAAAIPQRPYNQMRRLQVILGGALGGLALGLALIGLLEYRDSSFKTEDDVVRVLSLPVLAMVPMMESTAARQKPWWRRAAVGIVVGAVGLGSMTAIAVWTLR